MTFAMLLTVAFAFALIVAIADSSNRENHRRLMLRVMWNGRPRPERFCTRHLVELDANGRVCPDCILEARRQSPILPARAIIERNR